MKEFLKGKTAEDKLLGWSILALVFASIAAFVSLVFNWLFSAGSLGGVWVSLFFVTLFVTGAIVIARFTQDRFIQASVMGSSVAAWVIFVLGWFFPSFIMAPFSVEGWLTTSENTNDISAAASNIDMIDPVVGKSAETYGTYVNISEVTTFFGYATFALLTFATILSLIGLLTRARNSLSVTKASQTFFNISIFSGWGLAVTAGLAARFWKLYLHWGAEMYPAYLVLAFAILLAGFVVASLSAVVWSRENSLEVTEESLNEGEALEEENDEVQEEEVEENVIKEVELRKVESSLEEDEDDQVIHIKISREDAKRIGIL